MKKHFGICYYPELYPKAKQAEFIQEDIRNMRKAGFNVVRMAEFCWCLMEPKEGVYDFDWLEQTVNLLGENGIYTVMCTPTACHPVWMARKYPETLYVDNYGVRRSYGGRHYHCYNNPKFREFTDKICSEMGKRFGNNPYVLGFQVDNEMGQEHSGRCQCPVCRDKFKESMKQRYQEDIDALNADFGSLFWGQAFDDFDQVEPPVAGRKLNGQIDNLGWTGTNMPALRMAFERFSSDCMIEYFNIQREALRRYTQKPVTTNTTHFCTNAMDYFQLAKTMDLTGVDHYPDALGKDKIMSGGIYSMARNYHKKDFWLLETLCGGGHGNWAYQGMAHATPGTYRQNLAYAYASGAELITAFKYSVFAAGFENLGSGLIDLNRIPGRRYEEFCQAGKDLAAYEPILEKSKVLSQVAIVADYDSLWVHNFKPIHKDFNYQNYIHALYGQLVAHGINADIVGPQADLQEYKLVVVPFAPILPDEFKDKCRAYVQAGGNLAALCMPFSRTKLGNGQFECSPIGMTDVFGARVEEMEPVFAGRTEAKVEVEGFTMGSCYWQETLALLGAQAIGTFKGSYRNGKPVLTCNAFGKGNAYYMGTVPTAEDAPAFWGWLLDRCGVDKAPVTLRSGLDVVTRTAEDGSKYYFVFNSLDESQTARLSQPMTQEYSLGTLDGEKLTIPAKGFAILHA